MLLRPEGTQNAETVKYQQTLPKKNFPKEEQTPSLRIEDTALRSSLCNQSNSIFYGMQLNNYLPAEQVHFILATNQTSIAMHCNLEYLQSALQVLKKAALIRDTELQLNLGFLNCVYMGVIYSKEL